MPYRSFMRAEMDYLAKPIRENMEPLNDGVDWQREFDLDFTQLRISMAKISILAELWEFIRYRKKWWMAPILFVLVILGVVMVFAESSALAPFIYSLF